MGIEVTAEIEARVRAGERLDEAELRQLVSLDVLTLGMLADEARRRLHGADVTFVRVLEIDVSQGWTDVAVPDDASELRVRGLAPTLDDTITIVASARRAAGARLLSGYSLADIEDRSRQDWGARSDILKALRQAGLDAIAEAPIDRMDVDGDWWRAMRDAELLLPRLTVDASLGPDRVSTLLAVRGLQDAGANLRALAPLPRTVPVSTPTTGYDDVRAVALARLALDNMPSIQVDWRQYGPKLAQVALTFGADDIDGVLADDDRTVGWRRGPVEEVRRNIIAAGLHPVERDGRYVTPSTRSGASWPFDSLRDVPHGLEGRALRMTQIRLSAVSYLNTKPLVIGLEDRPDLFSVRFDVPSTCAALLHSGEVDLGLIPVIEYQRGGEYWIVPDLAIGSDGPVASVAVFSRVPVERVRTLALDTSSRTSVALTKILCAHRWGIAPTFTSAEPDLSAMLARSDAALLIGDQALVANPHEHGATKIDLGSEWRAMTGLPFVYAVWAGRAGVASPAHVRALQAARDRGAASLEQIAAAESGGDPVRADRVFRYLRDNLRHHLGEAEIAGLRQFHALAADLGLVPGRQPLRFYV